MNRLAAGLALALLPVAAFAQGDAHPVVDGIMAQLVPYIVAGVGLIITTLAGLVTAWLKAKWNIEISEVQAQKVTRALTNAAGGLIQKYGPEAAMKFDAAHPAVGAAAEDVLSRVGSAMKALGISPESVERRILEKIPLILPVDGGAPVAIAVAPAGETGPAGPAGPAGPKGANAKAP